MPERRIVYRLFADLLEYPASVDLIERAGACADALSDVSPRAASLIEEFRAFAERAPRPRLEELYTGTFDLKAVCHPYVGYHLFGESYKRGAFLARLNEGYRERGFSAGDELPDHLPVVLRFLALAKIEEDEFCRTLLREGVVPAVEEMAGTFGENSESADNPYGAVVRALSLVLQNATTNSESNEQSSPAERPFEKSRSHG